MPREPLYKQAETEMLRRIKAGIWPEGTRLGNEFELAREFGVSQGTMRRALITLEGMGYLHRKPGRGTVVSTPVEADDSPQASGFDRLTGADGAPLGLEVFRSRHDTPRADAADAALFAQPRLNVLERMLKLEGARVALETVTLPGDTAPGDDLPTDLAAMISHLGLSVARVEDRISAEMTSMGDSVALSVDRHTPLLCLTREAYGRDGAALIRQVLRLAGPAAYGVTLGA